MEANLKTFNFFTNPILIFGNGKIQELPKIISKIGNNILIVHGKSSIIKNNIFNEILENLKEYKINFNTITVEEEPGVDYINYLLEKHRKNNYNCIVSIGGGSVIDTGKALSAMIPQKENIEEYLEGIGNKKHNGIKVPFIAIPTTAGTGSEATKNAVISKIGSNGYKKSLRHDNFIPDIALIDPELTLSCPKEISVSSGLDALTQLIEGYLSKQNSPLTDCLALEGIKYFNQYFERACDNGKNDIEARYYMSYAAYLSGVVLTNAGLGIVHGYASSLGGLYKIPHGVICGTLLSTCTKKNIELMLKEKDKYIYYLEKYSNIGKIFNKNNNNFIDNLNHLIEKLDYWTNKYNLPKLSKFGVKESDLDLIVSITENKNNPIELDKNSIKEIIINRLK